MTKTQVSAGGVIFRRRGRGIQVALISVGDEPRWQLPKGLVGRSETPEETALREAREETGLECEFVAPIETVEYWYFSGTGAARVRFHKFVHFYLLRYLSGDVSDHDHEVNEARWLRLDEAARLLAFKGERSVVEKAREMLATREVGDEGDEA